MASIRKIQIQVTIKAPVEVVWNVMLDEEAFRRWTAPFGEGSYFEGSWDEGEQIRFLTPSGDGVISEIAVNRPNEFLSIRHIGQIHAGEDDTESESVREWAPIYENYTLSSIPGGTRVVIDQDVPEEYEGFTTETWPKALEIVKRICEDKRSWMGATFTIAPLLPR